jgi:hypothetical protein
MAYTTHITIRTYQRLSRAMSERAVAIALLLKL